MAKRNNQTPYLRLDFLQPLQELLIEKSVDPRALLARPEFRDVLHGDSKLSNPRAQLQVLEMVSKIINDPSFALQLGQRIQIASFGTVGFALMSCTDLREVIKLLIRYHAIINSGSAFELLHTDQGALLRLQITEDNLLLRQLAMELSFSSLCSMGEFLINRRIEGAELHFDYPPPAHAETYSRVFSMPIKFNQPHCQLAIPERTLSTAIRTANPGAQVIFLQQCDEMLRSLNRVENTSARVRRLLIQSGSVFPDIQQVAAKLHVTERTLRRRLSSESTNFRTICDEVKNVLACQYLLQTEFTVAEIANLLDYSETVSFRRAFVRWNGVTPSAFRQQQSMPSIA